MKASESDHQKWLTTDLNFERKLNQICRQIQLTTHAKSAMRQFLGRVSISKIKTSKI